MIDREIGVNRHRKILHSFDLSSHFNFRNGIFADVVLCGRVRKNNKQIVEEHVIPTRQLVMPGEEMHHVICLSGNNGNYLGESGDGKLAPRIQRPL